MKRILLIFISLSFILAFSHGQATRNYNCAIPSLCKDVVIDPRAGEVQTYILSPGAAPQTECPTGTVRCNSLVCGTPSVAVNSQSGFATQNSLPWQAYLRDDQRMKYVGGGVLIDQYTLLTAAHKISNLTDQGASLSVFMGVYLPSNIPQPPVQQSKVTRAYIHYQYDVATLKNDVAILRLATPMSMTASTMIMCLPTVSTNFITNPDTTCLVAGWGQTGFTTYDAPTSPLRQVYVPIVSSANCTQSFLNILQSRTYDYLDTASGKEICAGGQANLDSCTQDGGSPLICKSGNTPSYTLAGLVLWGKGCGQVNRYGVYLNVPYYMPWIQSTMSCSLQNTPTCSNTNIMTFTV